MSTPNPENQPPLFCIIGLDKPGHLEQRLENRSAHLEHWGALGGQVVFAGPFLDDDGKPCGSMIMLRAATLEDAQALADYDPYKTNGVFETVSVRRWHWFVNAPEDL